MHTRTELWRYPKTNEGGMPPARVGSPVIEGGELYSATRDGSVTVLDPVTGKLLRTIDVRGPNSRQLLARGIAVHGNSLLAVTTRGQLTRTDARTGERIWQAATLVEHPAGPPLTNGSRIVVVGENGQIVSVQMEDADAVGEYDIGAAVVAPAAIAGDALYVPAKGGTLLALDVGPTALRLTWQHVVPAGSNESVEITAPPFIHDDVVIFGTADMRLRAVVR
jgi:outer membrane protein assembly factor BamB